MLDDDLLDENAVDALVASSDGEVDVQIGTIADSVRERLESAAIDATVFTTDLIEWFTAMSDSPRLGRFLMVDRGPVLASALRAEELPGSRTKRRCGATASTTASRPSRSECSPTN